jgi:magnesium-transporting ATPase (P-type)
MRDKIWHAMDALDVMASVGSGPDGLTPEKASVRLKHYGPNRLPSNKKTSLFIRFLKQFQNLLIYVLLASAVITALMAHWVDSSVIFGVVLINAIIGSIQEGKAEKAMEAIRNILTFDSSVVRDGKRITVSADNLVPGDMVLLESGDKIPADMRLIKVKEFRVDEAILTGESVPVEKSTAIVPPETLLADRENMAFAGTFVT